jgi:putative acetyltransferase
MIQIRPEAPGDQDGIRRLNLAAFDSEDEANVVDRLRSSCEEYLSFVAVQDGDILGHILFTPATVDGCDAVGMGLAPMAVSPASQRRGIGSRLVRHGLEHLERTGCPFVIVLGHPEYYPRFGFEPASRYGISSQWDGIPDEAFMVLRFDPGGLPKEGGVARYRREFDAAM